MTHRLIDIFETLIDRFHETFVCINGSDFFICIQIFIHVYFVMQILKRKISLIHMQLELGRM